MKCSSETTKYARSWSVLQSSTQRKYKSGTASFSKSSGKDEESRDPSYASTHFLLHG